MRDNRGRMHRPSGLPRGVAGTYEPTGNAGVDDDLNESTNDYALARRYGAQDAGACVDMLERLRRGRYNPAAPLHRFAADGSIESIDHDTIRREAHDHAADIRRTINALDEDSRATHDFDGVLTAAMRDDAADGVLAESARRLAGRNPALAWADTQPSLENLTGVFFDDPDMTADMLARLALR